MKRNKFQVGIEFWCGGRQWRCTDIGRRVITAIRVDAVEMTTHDGETAVTRTLIRAEAEADGWFNGPPYAVAETVFDEYDQEGCSLEPDALATTIGS